ncbi:hypothetical protein CDD83_8970 [Cordyceps sp. RAO-2017]|nr:hypothetical protein CDD83_8970 [Cordyceps sp. RAO-2017]
MANQTDGRPKAQPQQAKSPDKVEWDVASREAQGNVRRVLEQKDRQWTGNYVRDFPDEFTTSWSTANSGSKSTLFPKDRSSGEPSETSAWQTANAERDEAELSSMDESFPSENPKLEPALSRQGTRRPSTRTSTSWQDEASVAEDCGGKRGPVVWMKHYPAKTPTPQEAKLGGRKGSGSEQAASYKILAYDAASDSINVAETSSAVHEAASTSSPAAVLTQLSNPFKFLPHFASLQAQGYEIASGGGDVLIFRKVREGAKQTAAAAAAEALAARRAQPVNPVDMMGKPVMGNFASPTGFVNYDAVADGGGKRRERRRRRGASGGGWW